MVHSRHYFADSSLRCCQAQGVKIKTFRIRDKTKKKRAPPLFPGTMRKRWRSPRSKIYSERGQRRGSGHFRRETGRLITSEICCTDLLLAASQPASKAVVSHTPNFIGDSNNIVHDCSLLNLNECSRASPPATGPDNVRFLPRQATTDTARSDPRARAGAGSRGVAHRRRKRGEGPGPPRASEPIGRRAS